MTHILYIIQEKIKLNATNTLKILYLQQALCLLNIQLQKKNLKVVIFHQVWVKK